MKLLPYPSNIDKFLVRSSEHKIALIPLRSYYKVEMEFFWTISAGFADYWSVHFAEVKEYEDTSSEDIDYRFLR